jgi:NAD(P)-dependent dehydrogenase (short-subunit alcohol dehydrogenase family)
MSRIAVVAGASGGIGGACARELGERGYELVLNARREAPLRALADEIGGRVVAGDCADEAVVQRIAESAGRIDVIVHSVGVLQPRAFRDQTFEEFDAVVRTNLRSAYVLVKACLPQLDAGSRIVLVSSIAPKVAMRQTSAYAAAKGGMNALAGVMARELEPDGINVHLVSPGPVDTPMLTDTPNPYPSLTCEDVAEVVAWLTTLPPHVLIREIDLRAAASGPFKRAAAGGS